MASGQAETRLEPPFTVEILNTQASILTQSQTQAQGPPRPPSSSDDEIHSLLPACYRTGRTGNDLTAADVDVTSCIESELDLYRLHSVLKQMWTVGRPIPPRPLHHQLLLSREIFITEQMDMHLLWTTGRIFLKPIPRFLLVPRIWARYLASDQPCTCSAESDDTGRYGTDRKQGTADSESTYENTRSTRKCNGGLRRCALGFLFSYVALIRHESDFHLAKEKHLLPKEVQWTTWRILVKELLADQIYDKLEDRFKYGELRLSRLNKIYYLRLHLKGYMTSWNQYGGFLRDIFTWLASTAVYIAIVLTAMQVGLATDRLKDNKSFESASYGFTVFSILGPLVTAGVILSIFFILFIHNWIITVKFWRERSAEVRFGSLRSLETKESRGGTHV